MTHARTRRTEKQITALDNPFSRFKPEIAVIERKLLDVEMRPNVKKLEQLFLQVKLELPGEHRNCMTYYNRIEKVIKRLQEQDGLKYTVEDIELFSIRLASSTKTENDFFQDKAGIFLSALINHGPDQEYRICTTGESFNYIGIRSTKTIRIRGDIVGRNLAHQSKEGTIIIENSLQELPVSIDILDGTGQAKSLIVNGDVGHITFFGKRFEEIRITGNVGIIEASYGTGTIYVEGEIGKITLDRSCKLKIYCGGKLVGDSNE